MGEFEMSQVGEGSKKIKNFKKFIPFIAVGGVLGLIVFLKRGGTSSVALEDPGIGGNIAGAVSDQVNQNNEDLKSYFSSNFDTLAGHLFDTVDRSTESLTGAIDKQSSVIDTLKEDVKVLQSKPAGTIVQSPIVSSPVAVAPSKGLYSQIFDSVGANNSIYGDSISDGIQYVEKKAVIDTTVLTPQEKISVKSVLAGLGNNGVGYNEEATRQNNNKLKTDSSYKQSEIERTNLVVKNRKAQGLETTLQKNYLKSVLAGLGNNGVGYNEEATRQNNNKLKTDSSYKQSEIERTNLVVKNRKAQGLETTLQENYLKSINGV